MRWGAREAERRALPLTLVHAASTQLNALVARWVVFGQHELPHVRVQRIVDDAIGVVTQGARSGPPVPVNTKVTFTDPVQTLADLSRQAELVVVGSSVGKRLRHAVFGTVGSALAARCQCSLAVIPADKRRTPHGPTSVDPTGW